MIFLPPGFFDLYIVYDCIYVTNSLIVSHNMLRIDKNYYLSSRP